MSSDSDSELLQRFSTQDDQAAFTEFVSRHVNLVYSTAVRQLAGDTHLARDVTQAVFTDTARKAAQLAHHRTVSGWLYMSTCFSAAKAVRSEQRRKNREQIAQAMTELVSSSSDEEWNRLRPTLDAALRDLRTEDREALLLRFFEVQPFSEIGQRLNLSENTARMRVDRALDKLRAKLARRGITSTAAALTAALTSHAITTAPAGLASSVSSFAVANLTTASGALVLKWFGLNKLASVSAAALLTFTAVSVHREQKKQAVLESELDGASAAHAKIVALENEVAALSRSAREISELRSDDLELDHVKADAAALHRKLDSTQLGDDLLPPSPANASRGHVYNLAELDRVPQVKTQLRPQYPTELRNSGTRGEVIASFVVTTDGTVTEAKAVDATHKNFEAFALEAVRAWTFTPGFKQGKPVAAKMVVPMVFQIVSEDPKWF